MKNLKLFAILILLNSGLSYGQDKTLCYSDAASEGMDINILDAGLSMIENAIKEDKIRGAVILVARDGKIVLHEAMGWKDVDTKIKMKKDAMFRMASNTKPVVATGIGILKDRNQLGYQDYVRKHITSFDNYRAGEIKIHHLLTHTSGFRIGPIFYRPLIQKSKEHPDAPNLRLEVDRFGATGAEVEVGKTYRYSNAGYNTLGALIETLSGDKLENYLRKNIYEPLGMKDSYHHETKEVLGDKIERMSTVYYNRDGKWTIGWQPGDKPQYPFVRASGGMISTALDYAVFCQMFLNGGSYGGKRILTKSTVEQMIYPQTRSIYTEDERKELQFYYGYGWGVQNDGIFGHSGSDGTAAFIDPNQNLIVLFFTQSPGKVNPLAARFFKLAQAAINE